jgi:DMSO/TMAO reductase YedYZ molybdopterin-dependent catalytic subunit
MVLVNLMRLSALALACAPVAHAEFSLTLANPVAARVTAVKKTGLAVRADGCADPRAVKLTATSVRLERGNRISTPVGVFAAETPGVFAIGFADDPGIWTLVLTGECGDARAGAIIPPDAQGSPDRDRAKVFNHAPTDREIRAALQEGGAK